MGAKIFCGLNSNQFEYTFPSMNTQDIWPRTIIKSTTFTQFAFFINHYLFFEQEFQEFITKSKDF